MSVLQISLELSLNKEERKCRALGSLRGAARATGAYVVLGAYTQQAACADVEWATA